MVAHTQSRSNAVISNFPSQLTSRTAAPPCYDADRSALVARLSLRAPRLPFWRSRSEAIFVRTLGHVSPLSTRRNSMSTATCTPDIQGPSTAEAASSVGQDANPAALSQAGAESCATKTAGQRDAKGRFLPGNFGGPGNPFARQLAKFRSFVIKCN